MLHVYSQNCLSLFHVPGIVETYCQQSGDTSLVTFQRTHLITAGTILRFGVKHAHIRIKLK
jgi:hypothetical protein